MYEIDSEYHRLRVSENDGIRMLRFERNRQSSMRVDDPFETDMEYPVYFHLPLAVRPDAQRALVVGLGGGSVVKRMWRDYPQMHLDVVEIDPAVVDIAHRYFAVPHDPRIRVFTEDGCGFVRLAECGYDLVLIDAFDDDFVPRSLVTEEFMRDCRDCMSVGGVVAYNVIGAVYGPHSRWFRSVYRTARNVWAHAWVFPIGLADDVRDSTRNIILIASDTSVSEDELLERIASRVDGLVTVPGFEQCGADLYRGKIRSGDVPLIVEHHQGRRR